MVKINNLSLCKNYMNCFDVMYISGSELWFGKYDKEFAPVFDRYMHIKDACGRPITLLRTEALCFYDHLKDSWISQIEDNVYVEFSGYTSDTLKEMASFAIDEISDCNANNIFESDLIANRIKNRFKTWFEAKNKYRKYNYGMYAQLNDNERAYLYFDEKACSEFKKTMNEIYGSRGPKYSKEGYKTNMHTPLPPQPKFVQFNGDYTTVVWKDGSHTVVKRAEGEEYDEEKAILFAIVKHLCKDNGCEMSRYFDKFFKNERNIKKED